MVATATARAPALCRHCGARLEAGSTASFCCRGCEEVHRLLTESGLARYYELGGGTGHPVASAGASITRGGAGTASLGAGDHKWLEPIAARLRERTGLARVALDVQGVHCAACVWLLEQLFKKEEGAAGIVVNPAIGSVELTIAPEFPLDAYVSSIEAFGYRFGPPLKADADRAEPRSDLVWRMGLCIAIAMNTMIFGFAIYSGLSEGPVYRLFHRLDFGLSFASVLIGGTVFFRSAWQSLRRRVLHLDLPIALGILLSFASSAYTYFSRGGATSYFDTLNVFIALMLVGRFLQERVLAKNRAYLLASDGAEGLWTRRVTGTAVDLVRCTEVHEGDVLLVGHQDLVPVDAELVGGTAIFSLDWINGESAPRAFAPGETVPAGAFCQDTRAARVRATADFDASSIVSLLRAPRAQARDQEIARATRWHGQLTRVYVAGVLAIAVLAFAGWMLATHDLSRTLDVVAALLIVTCPCAFGIATPLAYELAQAGLRRGGLFVRTASFLDRAAEIGRVVFDKTGTLTTGALVVDHAAALEAIAALGPEDRAVLSDLAVRSSHPKSRAIAKALEANGSTTFEPSRDVREIAGKGLELRLEGHVYRLGAPAWAMAPGKTTPLAAAKADVAFAKDGTVLASLTTVEELRQDAAAEVAALASAGYEPWILSGDSADATRAMADAVGIPAARAFGSRSPEGKAAWLAEHPGPRTLFVGDGINDGLVADAAYCAGTPAIDRPFMAARCDFYFVTPGLRPIRAALETAHRLAGVVRTNLVIAIFYNAVTVSLALAGLMTPLWCAVLMPLSSVSTVLATTALMKRRSSWTP
jgi:Cu2+-exporting ATPase